MYYIKIFDSDPTGSKAKVFTFNKSYKKFVLSCYFLTKTKNSNLVYNETKPFDFLKQNYLILIYKKN